MFLRAILSSFGPYSVYLCNAPAPMAHFFFFFFEAFQCTFFHGGFVAVSCSKSAPYPLAKQKLPLVCPQASPDITEINRHVRRTQVPPEQRREWGPHPRRTLGTFDATLCPPPYPHHRKNWTVRSPWWSVPLGSWIVLKKYTHPLGMKDFFLLRIITRSSVYAVFFIL